MVAWKTGEETEEVFWGSGADCDGHGPQIGKPAEMGAAMEVGVCKGGV